jgi:Trk-type K+ transport system membrane component
MIRRKRKYGNLIPVSEVATKLAGIQYSDNEKNKVDIKNGNAAHRRESSQFDYLQFILFILVLVFVTIPLVGYLR